jgi:hypothetical protein
MKNKKVIVIIVSILVAVAVFVGLRISSYNEYRTTIKPFYEHPSLGLTLTNTVVSFSRKHSADSVAIKQGIISFAEQLAKELKQGNAYDEQIALANFLKSNKIRVQKVGKAVCIYYNISGFFPNSKNEISDWNIQFPEFMFLGKNILLARFTFFAL